MKYFLYKKKSRKKKIKKKNKRYACARLRIVFSKAALQKRRFHGSHGTPSRYATVPGCIAAARITSTVTVAMHKVPGRAITEAAVPGLNTDSTVARA